MGQLDKDWEKIAANLQKQLDHSPLKPPKVMVPTPPQSGRGPVKAYSKEQRKVYIELWQDIVAIAERRNAAQPSFDSRQRAAAFHRAEMLPGFDGIRKIDRLSPYLEKEHYHLLRDYFNAYCNYHLVRLEKYQNDKDQDPSAWTEQDTILYRRVFTSGLVEKVCRRRLTAFARPLLQPLGAASAEGG